VAIRRGPIRAAISGFAGSGGVHPDRIRTCDLRFVDRLVVDSSGGGEAGTAKRGNGPRARAILALVCGASMVLLVVLGTRLTFFNDDWFFLLQRPGLEGSSVFSAHNGQLVVGVDLSFKVLVALFGYAQLPFRLTLGFAVAGVGVMVYLLVAERVGWLLGIAATAIVVLLGPAWEDLLFFASIGPIVALATGLGVLYVMEQDSPSRNTFACALLIVSVSFSGVGLAFVIAAAVAVLVVRSRPAQLWIPAVPTVLYVIWALWGGDSASDLSLPNLEHLPRYIFESASSGLASMTGLHQLRQGEVLLVLTLGSVAVWIYRGGRPSRWLAVPIAAALAFWSLTGLSFVPGREPEASRYQLVDAALLLVIAAELLRPIRLRGLHTAAVLGVATLVVLSNMVSYRDGYRFLRDQSTLAKAEIGALEIARGHTSGEAAADRFPGPNPYLGGITPGRYYDETSRHGEIAHLSPAEISVAPTRAREYADSILVAAYRMKALPTARAANGRDCRRFAPGSGPAEIQIRPGSTLLGNLGTNPLIVLVGRFSPLGKPRPIAFLAPRSTSELTVPRDSVLRPWRLTLQGQSAAVVCAPTH
jgi:hypothetical protein